MQSRILLALTVTACTATAASAEVKTKTVTYTHGGVTFKGHLAWDDAVKGKRPGVLIVHEWYGLDDYARRRAEQLAKLGYVAFAADLYGEGRLAKHPNDARQMATAVRKDVKTWVGRAQASLKVLTDNELVDSSKVAAIGYCFGGSTVLQLAYSGADVRAIVSFHGGLVVPTADQAKAIKGKVLICHGALDSFIPEETIQKVRAALEAAKADYQLVYYGGAYHSFTVPEADKAGLKGLAYNATADRRSWRDMLGLFAETLGTGK